MQQRQSKTGFLLHTAALVCFGLFALSGPAHSQQSDTGATLEEVQAEFSEAFEAIGQFSARERDEALAALDDTLQQVDERIEETEQAVRDNWSEMSQATREQTAETMRTLRERRNQLSKAIGALSQGAGTAWGDLMEGVRSGWNDLELAWDDATAALTPETESGN
ncbi:hypothetical protein [Yoonia sp.]|uniref:hypothetical protein n=1 Tax=Yoonia sp. TaxID=2212373 RepID=UPI003F6AFD01